LRQSTHVPQYRSLEIGVGERGWRQIGVREVGMREVGAIEIGAGQRSLGQVSEAEQRSRQIRAGKIGTREIAAQTFGAEEVHGFRCPLIRGDPGIRQMSSIEIAAAQPREAPRTR
jgi:hypothetical protein